MNLNPTGSIRKKARKKIDPRKVDFDEWDFQIITQVLPTNLKKRDL